MPTTNLARGAIPLALPNSCPYNFTGIPLFPAAMDAVWLVIIVKGHQNMNQMAKKDNKKRRELG